MRRFCLVGILVLGCFREAVPCDEATALAHAAQCRVKYAECQRMGRADDCPATEECTKIALERQEYCSKQIQENP